MGEPRPRPLWIEAAAAGALYAVLTFALAYPLSVHPGSTVLPLGADTNLFLWTIGWDLHAIVHQPFSIFDANIFFPLRHTLAYSENAIGSALLAAPVLLVSNNPVLALNVVLLLSCVLCGVGTYVLARRLGLGPGAAVIAGLIFAFTPPRFFRTGQLHLATIQWVPFCLASLHGYLRTGRRRDLSWAAGFLAAELLTSGHGTIFILFAAGGLVAWHLVFGEPRLTTRSIADAAVPAILVGVLAAAIFVPYRAAQVEIGLKRSLEDTYRFSANAPSFLASPTHLHRAILAEVTGVNMMDEANAILFPGYLPLALGVVGLWVAIGDPVARGGTRVTRIAARAATCLDLLSVASTVVALAVTTSEGFRLRLGSFVLASVRRPERVWWFVAALIALRAALLPLAPFTVPRSRAAIQARLRDVRDAVGRRGPLPYYAGLTAISLWLALGPGFGLYRLVYDWPGFSFIRVPSRFTLVTVLGLAVLAAAGFERLTSRCRPRARQTWTVIVGLVLVAEFFAAPLFVVHETFNVPEADRWLASQQAPLAVAEFPLADPLKPTEWNLRQSEFMLHTMVHWQKTIHGYSGITPRLHRLLYAELANFPDDRSLDRLEGLGVTFVVIHTDLYAVGTWPMIDARIRAYPADLTLVHEDEEGRVYRLRTPRAGGTTPPAD